MAKKSDCGSPSPLLVLLLALAAGPATAGLYGQSDDVVLLDTSTVHAHLLNSNSAWFVELYASWCGHCINFAPTWKALAQDIKDWRPAVYLAAMDCAEPENVQTCSGLGVTGFPTVQYYKAFAQSTREGRRILAPHGDVQDNVRILRHMIINYLEKNEDTWPSACPPLEPASATEVQEFFGNNIEQYLALIFEDNESYLGREVTMDMLQYENIVVRRVLGSNQELVRQYQVKSLPSLYVLSRNGSFSNILLSRNERSLYTSFLQTLPGVVQGLFTIIGPPNTDMNPEQLSDMWKHADKNKVYMADLESGLHYSLRVEVSKFSTLAGDKLTALRKYVTVLAKFFPARPYLKNLLQSLDNWLRSRANTQISYSDFRNMVDNNEQVPDAVLTSDVTWVGCQGSKSWLRGFPCSVWTLFHVLTVQAAYNDQYQLKETYPLEVLDALRGYVQHFFGCAECAVHFENMAKETMTLVSSMNEAILWLWSRHNQVNYRLAGAPSEDPQFPKRQWPSFDMCPTCRNMVRRRSTWIEGSILDFLKAHFCLQNIATDYLVPEVELLERQRRARRQRRKKRETSKERNTKEEKDTLENNRVEIPTHGLESHRPSNIQKPSIIWMSSRINDQYEDIVDLDSFVEQQYESKTLKDLTRRRKHKTGRRETLVFTMEEDQQLDLDYAVAQESLQKKGMDSRYLIGVLLEEVGKDGDTPARRRWFRLLGVGFSHLDISLCVILYFLSIMCLFGMYMYFSMKMRCRKGRAGFPKL
ncbi:sulfhydryl oxidase 1 [Microcaecilia unicolor]|uniref:Sulfhydryl oxidase n=1 Tax=Microcaecilia unicolor TaxID=1415580 RepID=A0A6P7YHS5_9AMPH|nr:sulfhydryl oxidase 1 [Microcaecilia unicolor]